MVHHTKATHQTENQLADIVNERQKPANRVKWWEENKQ